MASKASCGLAMVACSTAALAGTASQDLAVTATVANACTIKGPDADGPASVTCNSILSWSVQQHPPRATRWEAQPGSEIIVVTVTF